jgi:enoyl-CoA hydratase
MSENVTCVLRDGVAEIALDDGKVNAMTLGFFQALGRALDRAEQEGARTVLLHGRPGYFSAGLNIKLLPGLPPADLQRTLVAFGRTLLRVWTLPLPTVAATTGHAVAGGALLAFACDLRFMASGPYRLQMNETSIGLTLPSWAIAICEAAVPTRWRNEALLHARAYSPEEALERAMIDGVTPAEDLLTRARQAAAALAGIDRGAYAGTKSRLRGRAVAWAEAVLEAEMTALPIRPPA